MIIAGFQRCLSSEKGLIDDSNAALRDVGAALHQLSHPAIWEVVVTWVDYKPVDDRYQMSMMVIHECYVVELRIGMNVNDHCSLVLPSYTSTSIIYGLIIDRRNDKLSYGLITQLVEHCTAVSQRSGFESPSDLKFSGLSR